MVGLERIRENTQSRGGRVLDPERVREVHRLAAEGRLSQRQIALAAGVSRGSAANIISGRRPDYEGRLIERAKRDAVEAILGTGPQRRCTTCGGMVAMPCRACYVHRIANARPTASTGDATCRLALEPADRARYEEVKAIRRAAERNGE